MRDYSKVRISRKVEIRTPTEFPRRSGGSVHAVVETFPVHLLARGVLSLCLICSTLLFAQGTGGRILGRVADPSGAVLAGVKVTATNEATGVTRETQTNAQRRLRLSRKFRSAPTRFPSI